jgi:hypothetical protein
MFFLLVTLAGVLSIPFAEIDEPFAAWVNMDKRLYTIIKFIWCFINCCGSGFNEYGYGSGSSISSESPDPYRIRSRIQSFDDQKFKIEKKFIWKKLKCIFFDQKLKISCP